MGYDLPYSVEICGAAYAVRYDYRVILDIFEVLNEVDASMEERVLSALDVFYYDPLPVKQEVLEQAINKMMWFINGGKEQQAADKKPQLVAWDADFPYICAAINRVQSTEIRAIIYDRDSNTGGLHWWSFLAAYMEIGDCLFAQIVSIRNKRAKGKKLEKHEQEFFRENREIIEIRKKYSKEMLDIIMKWV